MMDEKSKNRYNRIGRNISATQPRKIKTNVPNPTESDYRIGYILRYFIQKTNDVSSPIYEVSNSTYNLLLTKPIYRGVSLKWRIAGPKETQYDNEGRIVDKSVSESNRIAIRLVSDRMKNLKLHLPNLLQFYK